MTPSDGNDGRPFARSALVGGIVSACVFLLTLWGIGRVGDAEAMRLLEATLPTIRFLGSAAIGAGATVLALMLTILSLTQSIDSEFGQEQFRRIRLISTLCVSVVIAGVGLLLFLTVPIGETDQLQAWHSVIYYAILVLASLLGGVLVAVMVSLRHAVHTVVAVASPHHEVGTGGGD